MQTKTIPVANGNVIVARQDVPNNSDELIIKEIYGENVYQMHPSDFSDDGVFVDIGANIGVVTVHASSLSPTIKIHSIEPENNNFELLKMNIEANGLQDRVTSWQLAISDHNGKAHIGNNSGGSRLSQRQNDQTTDVWTLEKLFNTIKVEEIDVLKIDVEGSEYPLLTSAPVEILNRVKYITIEFSNTGATTFGLMFANLTRCFNLHTIGSYERGGMVYGRRY